MPTRRDAATVSHPFSSAAAAAGPPDPTPRAPNKSDSSPRAHNSKHSRSTRLMAMMATTLAGGGPGAAGSLEARKWAALVATIWIQAFTGTNFDFSAYSSELKSVLGVSQVQLNYLAVASDLGKAVGWSSGLALLCLPLPVVLFAAAGMGLAGYGLQWLVITGRVSLPYFSVFLLCLLAGCSICWFNTVCFVLCVRSFSVNRPLALSLTVSFNGLSAALYTLLANALDPSTPSLYLLLNATVPLAASAAALLPILRQPPPPSSPPHPEAARQDSHVFLVLNTLAFLTGLYLLFLSSFSSATSAARFLLAGALALLVLPLFTPGVVCARDWGRRTIYSNFSRLDGGGSGFSLIDVEELEQLHKHLLGNGAAEDGNTTTTSTPNGTAATTAPDDHGLQKQHFLGCCLEKDRLVVLGEEHRVRRLISRVDFWLYYVAYFCGATVGLVYSNNIGQIAQSLGMASGTTMLVGVYSACSFFGRLLSSAPDFLRAKFYFARTGWLALALVPMPAAFFLLAWSRGGAVLVVGTSMVGLSSGFIFAAAVSVTSELFGPASIGVNHNVLITNIPVGSLLYGLLAALVYDANGSVITANGDAAAAAALGGDGAIVCMGRRCYATTFLWWGCITVVGLASSVALFLRTKAAYDRFERNRAILLS